MELIFNTLIGIVLLVFFSQTFSIEEMTVSNDKLGASGFPQLVIIVSLIILTTIIYKNIEDLRKRKSNRKIPFNKGIKTMLRIIALLATYIFTMNTVGFMLGSSIFGIVATRVMKYENRLKGIVFSTLLTIFISLIFGRAFLVSLPRGVGMLREFSYFIY